MVISQYEILRKVVELGNITMAAKKLNLTQPAVSHSIKNLEAELNIQLLIRGRSGARLTSDGETLYPYMLDLLNSMETLHQEAAFLNDLKKGTIRVGIFTSVSTYLLPKVLKTMEENYPDITIQLFTGSFDDIQKWIKTGEVDCGFIVLPNTNFRTFNLFNDRLLLVVHKHSPLTQFNEVSLDQIESYPFIMPKAGCERLIEDLFKEANVSPTIKYEIDDNHSILSMIKNNIGLSIIPEIALPSQMDGIKAIAFKGNCLREIGLAVNTERKVSSALSAFIQITDSVVQDV